MRKRTWFMITLIIAVIFIGYGYTKHVENNQYYQELLSQAESAINDQAYQTAQIDLENALKKKKNGETAQVYLKQVKFYRHGMKAIEKKQYQIAKKNFQQAAQQDNGMQILVSRATAKQTELQEVLRELPIFERAYRRAKILSTNYEYTASNTKLAVILGYGNIKQAYYSEIYQKAQKLQTYNNRILTKLGYHVDSGVSATDSSATDFLPGSSSSKTDTASLKKITAKQVKQARRDLTKEGVDADLFSDTQVKQVIQEANNQGVSVRQIAREFK
jgi:hypothetical protein